MLSGLERGITETPGGFRDCSRNVGKIGGAFKSEWSVHGHGECPEARRENVAEKICSGGSLLRGLQGPTVSPIYTPQNDGTTKEGQFYAVSIGVPKTRIYETVKSLRRMGGSGVLVFPMTYVFDEEPPRWTSLLAQLGLKAEDFNHLSRGEAPVAR